MSSCTPILQCGLSMPCFSQNSWPWTLYFCEWCPQGPWIPSALFMPLPMSISFAVAGADVQTLRERLIDALESHSVPWPPACPPLEPIRYWGLEQAWCSVGHDLRPRDKRVVGTAEKGTQVGSSWCLWGRHPCCWRAYAGALSPWG